MGSGPAIGAELGGYRLEALVGRGGMSCVYRAEDLRLGRRVALKVLSAEPAGDERFRARFLTESRLAASIDHANIVPIFEAGEADGLLYIAMRYVDGTDLRALLAREGPLKPARAVALVAQLACALDAAHARGLVHRDVKPSNALVAGDDHLYLADFGLTKHTASHGATASGQLVGTVDYVAPEQIRGEAVDRRADLYSLGCVLFECLTGEAPFARRSEVATIYAHLEADPPPASARPGVPPALDAVIARALAKEPARRWPTGTELAAAAHAACGSGAAGVAAPRRRRRPRAPRRAMLAALGIVAAAAAVTGGVLVGGAGGGAKLAEIPANAVAVIDPATSSLTAQVPVGASPSQMAVGAGAVWVTNADAQTVSRLDPASHAVHETIPVGSGAGAIAVGEGGVWVVNSLDGTLSWISPDTNNEVKRILVGNGPSGVCIGGGAVWVANGDDRTIWRLDPTSGRRTRRIALEARPSELACGDGAVWASSESSGTVTQVDAASGAVVRSVDVGGGASGLAFGGRALWVANTLDGTVSEVDPARGVEVRKFSVGPGAGPAAIAADRRGAWVSNEFAGTIARIDAKRERIVRTVRVGNRPQGIAAVGGELWVGVRAPGARHNGGALHVLSELKFPRRAFDPAVAGGSSLTAQIVNIANDGLTALRRVANRPGLVLVPDLAVSLPAATDRGRTYVFQMRPGIRYSSGALVRPADVRRGLERTLRAGSAGSGGFYEGIVGATACLKPPQKCDLSRGIVVDDAARTIAFHLTEADPDFRYKLALAGAVAVPAGTPDYPAPRPPPATGPYVIAHVEPNRLVRLARNPHFHAWSAAAKPDGYVNEITLRMGVDQTGAVRAVERGVADFVFGAVTNERKQELDRLFTRYPGQVHANAQAATLFFFLNTRVPPFDDIDVRRALNYAVDRRAAAALDGGPRTAQPTCQIVPPNFPGYRPYCPYTAASGPGRARSGPDLAEARRLVARSHTRGMRVYVWAPKPEMAKQARFMVPVLDALGYRASLRLMPFTRYWRYVSDSRHRAQIGAIWWGSDYPAARDFLQLLFSCRSFMPNDSHNINWSEFCDRGADRLMQRAARLQVTDETAANELWARVERRLVDRAAAVPLENPKLIDVLARRVGNYQFNPQWGVLLDQLWVR